MTAEAAPALHVPPLTIHVHDSAGTAVVQVAGELDTAAAAGLRGALSDVHARPGVTRCVVDLSGVTFVDCAGLQPLVEAHAAVPGGGCAVQLRTGDSPSVDRLLRLTGLADVLPRACG